MKKLAQDLFWVPIIILLAVSMLVIMDNSYQVINVDAQKGTVSLKRLDENGIVKIGGEWEYYPGLMIKDLDKSDGAEYVQVPHLFPKNADQGGDPYGLATYRLLAEGLDPDRIYGIQIINEASAYRLVVNGQEVLSAGTVGYTREQHRPEMKEKLGHFRADDAGSAEIFIEISNFSYNFGGFWKELNVGEYQTLFHSAYHQDGTEIFLFSSLLVLGLFLLGLYGVNRQFHSLFYYSMICIAIAIRTMLTNHRQFYDFILNISWDAGTRLEFLTGYLLLPLFGLLFYYLDYVKKIKAVRLIFHILLGMIFFVTIFTPNRIYANLLPGYMMLCLASLLYFGYMLIQGIRKKKEGAVLIFTGALVFIPAVIIDFYGDMTNDLLPIGVYFLLILFSIVVIRSMLNIQVQHDYLKSAILKDPLTGLYNRYYLNRLMSRGIHVADNRRLYILFFDLDRFKHVNDTYGHEAGDAVLIESARRLGKCFHRDTDILCRYGGDEFIAFIEMKDREGSIHMIIERIRSIFSEPFEIQGESMSLGISIGVSEYHEGDDLEKNIKKSDDSMYRAKKQNANGILIMEGEVSGGDPGEIINADTHREV